MLKVPALVISESVVALNEVVVICVAIRRL